MRSRLEASFAELLDTTYDLEWSYETQCFASRDGQYLPDFHVYWGWRDDWEYCEVKPENADFADALRRMHIILASEPLARLTVYTKSKTEDWHLTARCTPDDPCTRCGRVKLPRGYERP